MRGRVRGVWSEPYSKLEHMMNALLLYFTSTHLQFEYLYSALNLHSTLHLLLFKIVLLYYAHAVQMLFIVFIVILIMTYNCLYVCVPSDFVS